MACKCKEGAACACTVQSSGSMTVDGGGSVEYPLTLSINTYLLTVADTGTVDATISGDGSIADPYSISMRLVGYAAWTRWAGTQEEFDATITDGETLYVVTSPTRHIPNMENIHVGPTRVIRVYAGAVMVADDTGTVLGPGT